MRRTALSQRHSAVPPSLDRTNSGRVVFCSPVSARFSALSTGGRRLCPAEAFLRLRLPNCLGWAHCPARQPHMRVARLHQAQAARNYVSPLESHAVRQSPATAPCAPFILELRPITRTCIVRVMAHLGSSVEYALHCLLWLVDPASGRPSSRDLAELQGVSPSFLAKIFPKLEKAGIVSAADGLRGGYQLAKAPEAISVLDVVDAVEGKKPLFECQEIRGRCAVFGGRPPAWSTDGVCSIHALMLRAEQSMRQELAHASLASLAMSVATKAPSNFQPDVQSWFESRLGKRIDAKVAASRGNHPSTKPQPRRR